MPGASTAVKAASSAWPSLPLEAWSDTYATLHMLTQIVGKVRLARAPMMNHWWQVPLYVTSRGLTTSPIPASRRSFDVSFDFIDHAVRIETSDGKRSTLELSARPVAEFYRELSGALEGLDLETPIFTRPVEVVEAIPFERDEVHASYDREYVERCWRILVSADRVMTTFRSRFMGKASPVHFFWGSFDLATSRFSGRAAPPHPGGAPNVADWVMREAYSHEVSSCGFWPGGGPVPEPVFYAYVYPEPPGFSEAPVRPSGAVYHREMREFVLPYDAVRTAARPEDELLEFLQSTYEAAADLGAWDRAALERQE